MIRNRKTNLSAGVTECPEYAVYCDWSWFHYLAVYRRQDGHCRVRRRITRGCL